MLTPDEKRRVNEALTQNNGNRKLAAAALNMDVRALKDVINNNKNLKALWGKKPNAKYLDQPNHSQDVTVLVPVESDEQVQARREGQFQKLLHGVGEDAAMVHAFALQKAYGNFTEEVESLIGGTLVEQGIKLSALCSTLHTKLSDAVNSGALPEGFTSQAILFTESQKHLARIMEVVGASRLARAKIQALKKAGEGVRKGTVGFAPKTTSIIAQNVQVNG